MSSTAWKQFERDAALLFGGARFWANSGEKLDFEGRTREGLRIKGQCKLVKVLSLAALTKLAEEPSTDVVCVKLRRGSGLRTSMLVVMTAEKFQEFYGEEKETREAASAKIRAERPKVPFMSGVLLPHQNTKR